MKYAYHDLYPQQFEGLVVAICSQILGIGVQSFSPGPDGGRDARFEGKAEKFPSASAPWNGKFIVQAKHTDGIGEKFSDSEFSSDAISSVISQEIIRIKNLKEAGELDHYLLFTNRRMGANACALITERIKRETGVANVHLIGLEDLERFLKDNPRAVSVAKIDPIDSPLRVSPEDLAEIILHFVQQAPTISREVGLDENIERVKFAEKNKSNSLSDDYANIIKKDIQNFTEIRNFLSLPDNAHLLEKYQAAAEEFHCQIVANRSDYLNFDKVLNHIYDLLIDRDIDLARNKRLTRRMLHYMYWNCDIGSASNAEAE